MKKISLILAVVLSLQLAFAVGVRAETTPDTGKEQLFYYDFESFVKKNPHDRVPGSLGAINSSKFAFDTYTEDGNTVIRMNPGSEPSLFFGEIFKTGKLHISFDLKLDAGAHARLSFYDGRTDSNYNYNNDDPYTSITQSSNVYANLINITPTTNNMFYFDGGGNDITSWRSDIMPAYDKDMTQWHHFDLYFEELSDSKSRANYYMDGEKINTAPISYTRASGFKAFFIRVFDDDPNNSDLDDVFLDNLYVHRYYDAQEDLGAVVANNATVDNELKELEVMFTEPIEGDIREENITITVDSDGSQITDFDIIEETQTSVKLKINEALPAGFYNIKISDITGKYSGNSIIKGKSFRTAYRYTDITGDIYNEDFNSYTAEENAWPAGWITDTNENATNSAVRSVVGASGAEGDFAFGMEVATNTRRPIYSLPENISAGSNIEVSFDVKTDGSAWGLHLLDTQKANNYRKSEIIGMSEDDPKLKYSSVAESTEDNVCDSYINDELQLTSGEWHSVKLNIIPQSQTSTTYKISVDGGEEYTVQTARDFFTNDIDRVGLRFTGKSSGGTFAIDNLAIKSSVSIMQPEVENALFVDYKGNDCDLGKEIPIGIKEVIIDFNTPVYDGNIDDFITFEDSTGDDVEYSYEFNPAKDSVTLTLPEPLKSNTNYTFIVGGELCADINTTVKAAGIFKKTIKTEFNNALYEVYNKQFVEAGDEISYSVEIAKTDALLHKYIMAIGAYKTVQEDGVDYEELVQISLTPITLGETQRGYFNFGAGNKISTQTDYDKIKAYIFEYPQTKLVSVEEWQ